MILAAVWKQKQNGGGGYGLPGPHDQTRELAAIDASIQILEFCGHRNPFARRYSSLIKDLQRQLISGLSVTSSPSSAPPPLSSMSSTASVIDSDPASAESSYFQNLRISVEQNGGGGGPASLGLSRAFLGQASYPSESSLDVNLEGWSPNQFRTLSPGVEDLYSKSIGLLTIIFCYIMSARILTCEQTLHPPLCSSPMSITSGER
jgi:hypothetical protein